jgi:Uma2 family endonuclease
MGSAISEITVTPDEYLEGELLTDIRHEYLGGSIYAMGGASDGHNLIAGNIFAALHGHLRGGPCRAYVNDMKVRAVVNGDDYFYYPDVFVACQHGESSRYYKEHPSIIFEVLSRSTRRVDRREKFLVSERIPAFETYILVEQSSVNLAVSQRCPDGWRHFSLTSLADSLPLPKINFDLPLTTIYEDIDPRQISEQTPTWPPID